MNRVLTGLGLTASLPSPVYKPAMSRVYMRSLPLPPDRRQVIRSESEIALLFNFGWERRNFVFVLEKELTGMDRIDRMKKKEFNH